MNLIPINSSHSFLAREINTEFNISEDININQFVDFIIDIPKGAEIYVLKHGEYVIGCGTLIIERKMIHNFSYVGHIEDIFIRPQYRSKGYGKILISKLNEIALENKCYKVILDCKEELCKFYLKCGFENKNIQMSKYF